MEHTNDPVSFDPSYDIFENSSPQRPITSHDEPLPNDTVDEVLHKHNVVNFSRKRGPQDARNSHDQTSERGSKRHRHAQWPEGGKEQRGDAHTDQRMMSPSRVSKFHEGSMHDRPSDKPPSVFTRHFNKHVSMSVDELMEDYHKNNNKPLPAYPSARSPNRKRQSAPVPAPPSTFSVDTEDPKSGGIFRFGKSLASAFNPLSAWSKFTTGWRAAKEELLEEAEDAQKRELMERQKKAEQAYAELKQAGKLGAQGSHKMSGTPVFTPGYTQPADDKDKGHQRDSGISMDTAESRTSVDTSKGSFLLPADDSPRKSHRHTRTPSLHNLKKMASEFSLHRRSASASLSPEKRDSFASEEQPSRLRRSLSRSNVFEKFGSDEKFSSLRSSKSRNNLYDSEVDEFGCVRPRKNVAKQAKLTKRVSDLEAKLDSARKDLDRALGAVPPVPVLPPPSVERRLFQRPERRTDGERSFVPALPTVLSESLLVQPDQFPIASQFEDARTMGTLAIFDSNIESMVPSELATKEEALQESNGNGSYVPQDQALKGEFESSPPSKENRPGTPEHARPAIPVTPKETQTFLADTSSPRTDSAKKTVKKLAKKSPSAKKKRVSKEDKVYRPGKESSVDDDAEWEQARTKKKRKSDEGVKTSPNHSRSSRLPIATDSPKAKTKKHVLTKQPPPPPVHKELPPTPAELEARRSLDTVHEEPSFSTSSTTTVPVKNGSPRKPTARATPAFPRRGLASSSPKNSPYRVRKPSTPRRIRDERSSSPPPSSSRGKFSSDDLDDAVAVRPNGRDVPPLPGNNKALDNKSSFEWPEDVF